MTKQVVKIFKNNPDVCQQALENTNTIIDRIEDVSKKGILSSVRNFQSSTFSYTGTTSRPGAVISALNTTLTTTVNNSAILYDLNMFYELHYDNVFVLQRLVGGFATEIASGNPSGLAAYGFAGSKYDRNDDSTGSQIIYKFLDRPNVVSGTPVTYRILFYGSSNWTMTLNRVLNATTTGPYERGSSSVILREIGF
jgi:hypothetical protein